LVVVGKHPEKLELLQRLAVRAELLADFKPLPTADVVVEATGDPSGFALAMQVVAPRGVIVLKSTCAAQSQIDLAQLVVNEITVIGSRCGRFEPAIRALASGAVQVDGLISASYRLAEWRTAFEDAGSGALKVVIRMRERA
jgi:threonine dehydrogenase-like Zn-dependent dehydrogenase